MNPDENTNPSEDAPECIQGDDKPRRGLGGDTLSGRSYPSGEKPDISQKKDDGPFILDFINAGTEKPKVRTGQVFPADALKGDDDSKPNLGGKGQKSSSLSSSHVARTPWVRIHGS